MNIVLYFLIFISKVIENMLATLRLIVVSNGKKWLGAFLQLAVGLVWILVTGAVIININKDPLKVLFFALGSFCGSIMGSFLEEKMAIGSNMLICVNNLNYTVQILDILRNKGYAVTVLEGNGKDNKKNILLIMVTRKKITDVLNIIKRIDRDAMIVSESANTIYGGHKK